jgi:F0F1-type ATP synthase assembly protein I
MPVELQVLRVMAGYAIARAQAERRRHRPRNEWGASALEWAIISGILVGVALGIGFVVRSVIDRNKTKIEQG